MATVNGLTYPYYYNQQQNNQQKVVNSVSNAIQASQSPSRLNTDAIYTTWNNPNSAPVAQNEKPLTILHLNDNHRKVSGLSKFKTAIDEIRQKVVNAGGGILNAHSGDYNAGTDLKKLQLQIQAMNDLGINFSTIGNHELDVPSDVLAKALQEAKFVSVTANLTVPAGNSLDALKKAGKLVNSAVYETGGNKYGVIGLSPMDLMKRIDPSTRRKLGGVDVLDKEQTFKIVQQEVDKLKAQGINRIVLISHIGLEIDREIAQATDGIDIILGGHSHDLLDPLEPGVSLFNSKSNEPVLIFQNGKNAKYLGVTDAYFDNKGIVKAAIARQEDSDNFGKNDSIESLQDKILGKSPVIGVSAGTYTASGVKLRENAIANFVTDAIRNKYNADVAIIRGSEVRDTIPKGEITERDIDDTLPFVDYMYKVKISGQDIVDAINNSCNTYLNKDRRPGIVHLSGAKYTVSAEGKATDVQVMNKNGQYEPIDLNKEYTTVYNGWSMKGAEGFTSLAQPLSCVEAYNDIYADVTKEAIKQRNFQPIEMKTEGRITVYAKDPMAKSKQPKAQQKASTYQQTAQTAQVQQNVVQQVPVQQNVNQSVLPELTPRCAYRMPQAVIQNNNYSMYPPVVAPGYYTYMPQQPVAPVQQPYYYNQNIPVAATSFIR
ncbi:MAG: bifunctional UDP-sugar hydrolase/5'-nucleotidase [Vampirovibrionia bacterium]